MLWNLSFVKKKFLLKKKKNSRSVTRVLSCRIVILLTLLFMIK